MIDWGQFTAEACDDGAEDESDLIAEWKRAIDEQRALFGVGPRAQSPAAHEPHGLRRDRLLRELRAGQVCRGTVTKLCDFGAFVDLGGIEGLVHISEIAWHRVPHPRDVLEVGQEIAVQVLRLDPVRQHVALSIKRTQPNPWASVAERFQVGQLVRGTITHVVDYGAFARVDGGIEGLIHLSELAEGDFRHPRDVVAEGDEVNLVVIRVEPTRRRLGLSLKRASVAPTTDTIKYSNL